MRKKRDQRGSKGSQCDHQAMVSQDHKSHVAIPLPPGASLGRLRKSAREEAFLFQCLISTDMGNFFQWADHCPPP